MSLKHFFQEVDNRLSLANLIGQDMKLTKRGREYVGLCPFHHEKTPSFSVVEEKHFYHCFGCGKHGRAVDWLTERRGLDFKEAIKLLSQLSGVALPTLKKLTPEEQTRQKKEEDLHQVIYPNIMGAVADYYHRQLFSPEGKKGLSYLQTRGLQNNTIKKFLLGYAVDEGGYRNLLAHVVEKIKNLQLSASAIEQHLITLGVMRKSQHGDGYFLFFRDRVMFPIHNQTGKVVGFGGRFLGDATTHNTGKYINSPDSPIFTKGRLLYHLKTAKETIKKSGDKERQLLLVEGYMDVIALAEAGLETAVAPLGTAVTESQLELLWQVSPRPVMVFDGDHAGQRAAQRVAMRALPHINANRSLTFVFIPEGEDPDSLVRQSGKESMESLLRHPLPLHEFLWRWEKNQADWSRPEGILALQKNLQYYSRAIQAPDLQKLYASDFNNKVFQERRKSTQQKTPAKTATWQRQGRNNRQSRGRVILPPPSTTHNDMRQKAIVAIISLYPAIYEAWQDGEYPEITRYIGKIAHNNLDNYLKNLHIYIASLSVAEGMEWQNALKEQFVKNDKKYLWDYIFSKNLISLYKNIFDGNEANARELLEQLMTLESIEQTKNDLKTQAQTAPDDDWNKKIEYFEKEITHMEGSLHRNQPKEKS